MTVLLPITTEIWNNIPKSESCFLPDCFRSPSNLLLFVFQLLHLHVFIILHSLNQFFHKTSINNNMARTSNNTAASSAVSKAESPPAKATSKKSYTKRSSKDSPTCFNSKKGSAGRTLIYISGLESDDIVTYAAKENQAAPFMSPTVRYLNQNRAFALESLHINHTFYKVDPHDITVAKVEEAGTYQKYWPVFVTILGADMEGTNTPENRRNFADSLVQFLNLSDNQKQYSFPQKFAFGGDVTPLQGPPSKLSDYCCIKDVITVLQDILSTPTNTPSIGDVLEETEALMDYFTPPALEQALTHLDRFRHHIPGGIGHVTDHSTGTDFTDFEPFQFK